MAARRDPRLGRAATALVLLATAFGAFAPAAGAQSETRITYSVREARAYAYRVSLSKEVIEAARTLQPCDPAEDPYACDDAAYEHTPNCPPALALGRTKPGPAPEPAPGIEPVEGGAGEDAGAAEAPRLASPITLNEQLTLANLSRLGATLEAGGFATDSYVDLSGRQEPAMHTESDAFSPNRASYEERCVPEEDAPEDEYARYLSRSFDTPETYHLAECREGECTFGGAAFGAEAEEARTVVHLYERGGRLNGRIHATLHDAIWGGGLITADLLDTTIVFSTDGTPEGLRYSVGTTAAGLTLAGTPISLPPGRPLELPGVSIGIAAPFVKAADTGRALDVIAAGLYIATDRQTVLFGGAELHATMGREPVTSGGDGDGDDGTVIGGGPVVPPFDPGGATPSPSPSPAPGSGSPSPSTPDEPELAVSRVRTGGWAIPLIVGAGLLAAVLILIRWLGRYPWSRRLYQAQPFRAIDWIYRAFVKS